MSERIQPVKPDVEGYSLQFLNKGRESWDVPHTQAVVYYAGLIAVAEKSDIEILKSAAWMHDIGYFELFTSNESTQHDTVLDMKKLHMSNGARLARRFLESPIAVSFYTPDQIQEIIHLIEVHDDFEVLGKTKNEIILMEADTLGAIDLSRVKPTFDKENGSKYIAGLKKKREPRFQTTLGKKLLSELLPAFTAYFEEMSY